MDTVKFTSSGTVKPCWGEVTEWNAPTQWRWVGAAPTAPQGNSEEIKIGDAKVKEHPIIFSTDMVRAILEDRKTQTRRVITPHNSVVGEGKVDWDKFCWDGSQIYRDTCIHGHMEEHKAPLPFVDGKGRNWQYLHVPYDWEEDMKIFRIYPRYEVGDRLWVKETIAEWQGTIESVRNDDLDEAEALDYIVYKAGARDWLGILKDKSYGHPWNMRPSIHMPRWASRITLEITEVRVEMLQEITLADVIAEGFGDASIDEFNNEFLRLNPKLKETNPWVWVISFATGERLT